MKERGTQTSPLGTPSGRRHGAGGAAAGWLGGIVLAGALLAAGCQKQGEGAPSGTASSGQASGTPASAGQAQTAAAGGSGTGFSGDTERLDTGVDLTKLDVPAPTPAVAPAAFDPNKDQDAPPGHLALAEGESQQHDFGPMKQGDKGRYTFKMVSDGDAPLVITRLKPSCGCTVAAIALVGDDGARKIYHTGEPIPPGTDFEITVELNTENKEHNVSTSVAIYSNDPRAVYSLGLKADVRPVILIEPAATIAFGDLKTTDTATKDAHVSSDSLPPFKLTLDDRYLRDQPVKVTAEPVDPDDQGRSKSWNVHITIGPNFPREGIQNFPIILNTDQAIADPRVPNPDGSPVYQQARIYAQATVSALVSAEPSFLSLGLLRPGESVERTVRISCLDDFQLSADAPVRIEGIRGTPFPYADRFELSLDKVEGENALDLHVKLLGLPDDTTGSFGGLVLVDVGHPNKKTVEVRFSGICRAGLPASRPAAGGTGSDVHTTSGTQGATGSGDGAAPAGNTGSGSGTGSGGRG